MSTDRIIESARQVAELWETVGDPGIEMLRKDISPVLARALDELVRRCSESVVHRATSRTITERGRAENGFQPERTYVWSCSCTPGWYSNDQGGSGWAKQAADRHREDPERYPAGPR